MEERIKKWNSYLLLPGAIVALLAGLVSIYKETYWYVYIPLFAITLTFIVLVYLRKKEIHEFEVLWQEMTVDIQDSRGQETLFTNHSKLRALKAGAHNFDYVLYCDGRNQKFFG
jgi:general stress protein CsbA